MAFDQPLPAALSPSRLADFQACPRRYQHASIERIPQPATYATAKGRLVHYVLEHLFALPGPERTRERAGEFVAPAFDAVVTDDVAREIALDDARRTILREEVDAILTTYFTMEDPATVESDGVELRLHADVDGAPVMGILDRLDRDEDGELTIVDYKTGAVPDSRYDSYTFANTELYAALCERARGQRPKSIRLLYVTHGREIERGVSPVVTSARADAAARAWSKITRYYADGEFPATPSPRACRFCSYQDLCRADGVPVPVR